MQYHTIYNTLQFLPRDVNILTTLMLLNKNTYYAIREDSDGLLWNWLSYETQHPTIQMDNWIKYASLFSHNLTFGNNKIGCSDEHATFISDDSINGIFSHSFRLLSDVGHGTIGITDGIRKDKQIGLTDKNFEYSVTSTNFAVPFRARHIPINNGDIVTLISNARDGILLCMINFKLALEYIIPKTEQKLFVSVSLYNSCIEVLGNDKLTSSNVNSIVEVISNVAIPNPSPPTTNSLKEALITHNMNDIIWYRHSTIDSQEELVKIGLENDSFDCIRYLLDCNIVDKMYVRHYSLVCLQSANRRRIEFILDIVGKNAYKYVEYMSDFLELFPSNEEDILRWILSEILDLTQITLIPNHGKRVCHYRYITNVAKYSNVLSECGLDCSILGQYARVFRVDGIDGDGDVIDESNHQDFYSLILGKHYDRCQWMIDNIPGFKDEFCYQLLVDRKPTRAILDNVLSLVDNTLYEMEDCLTAAESLENDNQIAYLEWIINNDILSKHTSNISLKKCARIIRKAMHVDTYENIFYPITSKKVRYINSNYKDYVIRTIYPLLRDHIQNYDYTTYRKYANIREELEIIDDNYLLTRFDREVLDNIYNTDILTPVMLINCMKKSNNIYVIELKKYLNSGMYCTLDGIWILSYIKEDNIYYEDIILAIIEVDMKHLNKDDMTSLKNSYDLCMVIWNTKYREHIIQYIHYISSLSKL